MKYRKLINTSLRLALAGLVACVMLYGAPLLATDATGVTEPTPVQLPEHLTQEDVRSLIARLPDDQVRALLIQQLDKVAQAERRRAPRTLSPRQRIDVLLEEVETSWRSMVHATTRELPHVPAAVWTQVTDAGLYGSFRTVLELALALFVGWVLERAFRHVSAGVLRREDGETESVLSRLFIVAGRVLLGFMGLALFGLGTTATGALVFGEERTSARQLLHVLMWGIVVYRVWALFLRAVLAPKMSAWRLIALPDSVARGMYTRTLVLVALFTISWALEHLLVEFLVDWDVSLALGNFVVLVIVAILLGMILQARKPVGAMIRGEVLGTGAKPHALRVRLANMWHLLAIAYVILHSRSSLSWRPMSPRDRPL